MTLDTFVNPSSLTRTVYLNWDFSGVPFKITEAQVKQWIDNGFYEPWLFEDSDRLAQLLNQDPTDICMSLFMKYNADERPDGQQRRSMSVGDLVQIGSRTFLCDRLGFIEIDL